MRFFKKHIHKWKVLAKTYAPPVGGDVKASGYDSTGHLERLKMGVTTIMLICEDPQCDATDVKQLLGKEILDEQKR